MHFVLALYELYTQEKTKSFRERLSDVISVRFQVNSSTVHLLWESDVNQTAGSESNMPYILGCSSFFL